MKSVKFFTLGCKVNQYDTQLIREQFLDRGFKELENSEPADVYVINTCSVTQHADAQSLKLIRYVKRENPQAKIIVTGCLTELDELKITEIAANTLIVKNKDKENIINLKKTIAYFKDHTRAFLKIQDGCNNFCSYCKVPLVRGGSRSKPLNELICEAEELVRNGFKEIVLCGICLGAYGRDLSPIIDIIDVITQLEEISELSRIRLSSIEPGDVSTELINKMVESKKLCHHLHIPLQSADDEILRRMNRNYSHQDYLSLIKTIRCHLPDVGITTDVLIGFPGETEINFENTVDLIRKISPLKVHIFPYSPRIGTLAFDFKAQINPTTINRRSLYLRGIAKSCSLVYKKQFLNRNMSVLIEAQSKDNPVFWEGYTDNYIKVKIGSEQDLRNRIISLRLKKIIGDFVLAN